MNRAAQASDAMDASARPAGSASGARGAGCLRRASPRCVAHDARSAQRAPRRGVAHPFRE